MLNNMSQGVARLLQMTARRRRAKSALLLAGIAVSSCGRSTKVEYVYVTSPAAGAPSGVAGSGANAGRNPDAGGATSASGAGGSTNHGTVRAGSPEDPSAQLGSPQGGSGSGGVTDGPPGQGGSAVATVERGGAAQGGSLQAGAAQGGSAQAGSPGGAWAWGGTAGKRTAGDTGGYSSGPCPTEPPAAGDACTTDRRLCTWGDSGLPECRTFLVCSGGRWVTGTLPGVVDGEPGFGSICRPPPAGSCPNDSPPGEDCTAELNGARCQYSDGSLCTCMVNDCNADGCSPLPSPEWTCNQILPPCPGKIPNSGTSCTGPDGACTYEYSSLSAQCISGIWEWQLYWPE